MQIEVTSWCLDSDGNKIERLTENGESGERIAAGTRVTLSGRGKQTEAAVRAWYWRSVAWWTPATDKA